MTNKEMERAIEFLLKNQANFEARLEQTTERLDRTIEQVNQTNRQLEKLIVSVENLSVQLSTVIETQNEFTQIVLQHITAQGEVNASVRDSLRSLNTAVERHLIEACA